MPRRFLSGLIKSCLANTSRDSFKFCQLLGKSGQARFMQHNLLHKGMKQGELLVCPTELDELGKEKTQIEKGKNRAVSPCHATYWFQHKGQHVRMFFISMPCVLMQTRSFVTLGPMKNWRIMHKVCLHPWEVCVCVWIYSHFPRTLLAVLTCLYTYIWSTFIWNCFKVIIIHDCKEQK